MKNLFLGFRAGPAIGLTVLLIVGVGTFATYAYKEGWFENSSKKAKIKVSVGLTKGFKDIKRLRETKENEDIIEIINNCKIIHIDTPPSDYGKISQDRRKNSRKKILDHLESNIKSPLLFAKTVKLEEINDNEREEFWLNESLENRIVFPD